MSDIRVDKIVIPKMSVTKDGYLRGDAIVTRTGVFKYMNADGSVRLELRHPDDIFKQDSLDTLKSIPVTNDHPRELVTTDNVDKLLVGMTGETVKLDGNSILTTLTITHKDAIDIVNSGKQELSLGYKVDVIAEDGEYEGEKYTHRQTNVDYNHLAIVEVARAGRSARINLDGALIQIDNLIDNKGLDMTEKEKETIVETEDTKVETETVNADTVHVNLDKYLAIIDQLKLENAELKAARVDSIIADKVKTRIELINKTSKVINMDSDEFYNKSDREIMELVIKSADTTISLDDKSDAYVSGRFDAIIDMKADHSAIKRQMNNIKTDSNNTCPTALSILQSHSQKKA